MNEECIQAEKCIVAQQILIADTLQIPIRHDKDQIAWNEKLTRSMMKTLIAKNATKVNSSKNNGPVIVIRKSFMALIEKFVLKVI